jgi:hypothetical protein
MAWLIHLGLVAAAFVTAGMALFATTWLAMWSSPGKKHHGGPRGGLEMLVDRLLTAIGLFGVPVPGLAILVLGEGRMLGGWSVAWVWFLVPFPVWLLVTGGLSALHRAIWMRRARAAAATEAAPALPPSAAVRADERSRPSFVLMSVLVALYAGLLVVSALVPDWVGRLRGASGEVASAPAGCDPSLTACAARFSDGAIVRLSASSSQGGVPLRWTVQVEGDLAPTVVEASGLEMNMGLPRAMLRTAGEGTWTGEVVLPACSEPRMRWQVDVLVTEGGADRVARFAFTATKPAKAL